MVRPCTVRPLEVTWRATTLLVSGGVQENVTSLELMVCCNALIPVPTVLVSLPVFG